MPKRHYWRVQILADFEIAYLAAINFSNLQDEDDDGSDTESGAEPDEHETEAIEGAIKLDSD